MLALFTLAAAQAALAPSPAIDWQQAPLTAGVWIWRSTPEASEAIFSDSRGPAFVLRCTRATRRVSFSRTGALPTAAIRLATTSSERLLPPGHMVLASDPLLDAISFSRGRLGVIVEGSFPLVLRSAPEPARAIEDCRS